ncbi:CHAP domain-containing protein [Skermania sp. ID1734]|uniref:CHAP domain-containing protein n=1 Tax=Skermania sp. ID1734 TaxID=2597516 RepID=UPI00117E3CE9|nr:CHAP domain-containing protein [Skermania sp. ID1734]TSD99388.1 CHAP domain-containing protein [Skermania sp. ID1734]
MGRYGFGGARLAGSLLAAGVLAALPFLAPPVPATAHALAGINDYPFQTAVCVNTGVPVGLCPSSMWAQFGATASPGGYNYRNCTDFAAFRANQIAGRMVIPPGWGNASNWANAARAVGLAVDGNPRVGDVAQSSEGFYGHVAIVAEVGRGARQGQVRLEEYNRIVNGAYDGLYHNDRWSQIGAYQYIHVLPW